MSSCYSNKIYKRIVEAKNKAVFIANDFLDIADYETVHKTLNRFVDYGKIKKISWGLYYNPNYSELLKEYEAPSLHYEANRPEHLLMPSQYSRHYYDLYWMAHSKCKNGFWRFGAF